MTDIIKVASRRSDLAVARANLFIKAVAEKNPALKVEHIVKVSDADKYMNLPFTHFGKQGGYTGVFEDALLNHEIDIAVHCAKDIPLKLDEGLAFSAFDRGDDRSVVIFLKGAVRKEYNLLRKFTGEDVCFRVSNISRKVQIESFFRSKCELNRANVPEQIAWLRNGECDCIMTSASAVELLHLKELDYLDFMYMPASSIVPVYGQSMIGIEYRKEDKEIEKIIKSVMNKKTEIEMEAERYLLSLFDGGVDEIFGVNCHIENEMIRVAGMSNERGVVQKAFYTGDAVTWSYLCDKVWEKLSGRR